MIVATPPLDSLARTPPARPAAPRELLAVPGQPRALEQRPDHAPGRIPVPGLPDAAPTEPVQALDEIEARKDASVDYQILKDFLAAHGRRVDDRPDRDTSAPPARPETARADAAVPQPAADLRPEQPRAEPQRREAAADGERATPQPPVRQSDPLALDLDGDGLRTTGVERGVAFDIDGDGVTDRVSFVTGGDAFVALDRNGNGVIDSGRELFGDQLGHANGFLALADHDANGDRRIDAGDAVYADLRLLRIDSDGSQSLTTLAAAGVRAIHLDYVDTRQALNAYDSITQLGRFERSDGSTGTAGDLLLGYA